jgi:hypothetical protein
MDITKALDHHLSSAWRLSLAIVRNDSHPATEPSSVSELQLQEPSSTNWPLAAIAESERPQVMRPWFKLSFWSASGEMYVILARAATYLSANFAMF